MPNGVRARWGWRHAGLMTAIGSAAAFVALLSSTAGPFRAVSGRASSAREANARLWNCHVPDDATDVWYRSAYRATQVECTLNAASFESWCRRRGWRPVPIAGREPAFAYSQRVGEQVIVRGSRFDEKQGDLGFYGLYDAARQRAYVNYSGG